VIPTAITIINTTIPITITGISTSCPGCHWRRRWLSWSDSGRRGTACGRVLYTTTVQTCASAWTSVVVVSITGIRLKKSGCLSSIATYNHTCHCAGRDLRNGGWSHDSGRHWTARRCVVCCKVGATTVDYLEM
jgi:hypothetical protein